MIGVYKCEGLNHLWLHDKKVLEAMSRVPRHLFIPDSQQRLAYEDCAVPIDCGQTISQPFIVALMTQEAKVAKGSKVLEIGTGSGYQAAVLAELGCTVYSIEIIPELSQIAEVVLAKLNYTKIFCRQGDGWKGIPEEAPFDAIFITAAVPDIPDDLLMQLKDGGRCVMPLENEAGFDETLMLMTRKGDKFSGKELCLVRFVPMTGQARQHEMIPNPREVLIPGTHPL